MTTSEAAKKAQKLENERLEAIRKRAKDLENRKKDEELKKKRSEAAKKAWETRRNKKTKKKYRSIDDESIFE